MVHVLKYAECVYFTLLVCREWQRNEQRNSLKLNKQRNNELLKQKAEVPAKLKYG